MIKYDKEQNLMVELLEVQRPLPLDIIQEYDHKKVMKDVKKIIETLTDNYFYHVAYQEFLKYEIDDNLKMAIQLGLTIEEDMDKSMREIMLKYIDKNMIKTFSC